VLKAKGVEVALCVVWRIIIKIKIGQRRSVYIGFFLLQKSLHLKQNALVLISLSSHYFFFFNYFNTANIKYSLP